MSNTPMDTSPDDGSFSVTDYLNSYRGAGRQMRAEYIVDRVDDHAMKREAFGVLIDAIKKDSTDTSKYKAVVEKWGELFNHTVDEAWMNNVDRQSVSENDRLEAELSAAMSNSDKNAVRAASNALGKYYTKRGMAQAAMKHFAKVRDYTSNAQQTVDMTLNILYNSLQLQNYAYISNYATKSDSIADTMNDIDRSKVSCYKGLVALKHGKQSSAARFFLSVNADMGNSLREVVTQEDVAIYGGICALVTYERKDLKKHVLNNGHFQLILQDFPVVRDLILSFYETRYGDVQAHFQALLPRLMVDVHLGHVVENIRDTLFNNSLVQYFRPYKAVDLHAMAKAFNRPVDAVEADVARLIGEGKISARIDSHNKRLIKRETDARTEAFNTAMDVGQRYESDTKAAILRIGLLRHDLSVKGRDISRYLEQMAGDGSYGRHRGGMRGMGGMGGMDMDIRRGGGGGAMSMMPRMAGGGRMGGGRGGKHIRKKRHAR